MARGIRIRDPATGLVVLDVVDRITRLIGTGSYSITPSSNSDVVTVSFGGMQADGTWLIVAQGQYGQPITWPQSGYFQVWDANWLMKQQNSGTYAVYQI